MVRRSLALSSLLLLALDAGCQSDIASPFLAGLQPVEAVTVPPPAATPTDPHPEVFNTTNGRMDAWEWAQGTGYVHASVTAVYAALRDPAVTADRRKISSFTATQDVAPLYPHSYLVHNVIHDVVTVEFDEEWHLGPLEGTDSAPTVVTARYQKVMGTSFISLMEGDIVARAIDANTTQVEMMRHVKSIGNGAADEDLYEHDVFNSIVAQVHGRPLPSY